MSFNRRHLVHLAALVYAVSLVMPAGGAWFAGLGLMVVSTLGAIFTAGAFLAPNGATPLLAAKGIMVLLLPAYNLMAIYAILVLRRNDYEPRPWLRILLAIGALTALYAFWGFSHTGALGTKASGVLQLLGIWALALALVAMSSWLPPRPLTLRRH